MESRDRHFVCTFIRDLSNGWLGMEECKEDGDHCSLSVALYLLKHCSLTCGGMQQTDLSILLVCCTGSECKQKFQYNFYFCHVTDYIAP
jgi:hypothetical protein